MTTPLQRLGGPERLREAAVLVLAFVGATATVAALTGTLTTLTAGSLFPVGGAAMAVVALTTGLVVRRALALRADPGGRPDTADSLVLYQAEGCPHCAAVRRFCTRRGISLTLHNPRTAGTPFTDGTVTNRDRHAELEGYGRDQVPLLVDRDRGESTYESDDIRAYLERHYA